MKSLKKRIKRKYLFVYIHNRVNYSVKWKFYGLHVKKDEVYTVKVILQSIYWTYSWPCKQLKKIWSVICAQFKLLYHIPQDIVICIRCQELENEGTHRQGGREDSSIFKSLHAASIVNWEILHLQQKRIWCRPKNIPFTLFSRKQFSSQVIYLFTVLNFSR